MACLDTETLTCPNCGMSGDVVWIVGVGPASRAGEGPAYESLRDSGPFRAEATETHPFWAGRLYCPSCGEIVKRVPESTIRRSRGRA